jgi:hypothetical protein
VGQLGHSTTHLDPAAWSFRAISGAPLKHGRPNPMNSSGADEGGAVQRIQITKPVRRPAEVPVDLRTPSGRQLPY